MPHSSYFCVTEPLIKGCILLEMFQLPAACFRSGQTKNDECCVPLGCLWMGCVNVYLQSTNLMPEESNQSLLQRCSKRLCDTVIVLPRYSFIYSLVCGVLFTVLWTCMQKKSHCSDLWRLSLLAINTWTFLGLWSRSFNFAWWYFSLIPFHTSFTDLD